MPLIKLESAKKKPKLDSDEDSVEAANTKIDISLV